MSFVEIAATDELTEGNMKMVKVSGREILLAKIEDNYYGAYNKCPHMGGNLSMGKNLKGLLLLAPTPQPI